MFTGWGKRPIKMKVDSLISIIFIFIIPLVILGIVPGMASALDVNSEIKNSHDLDIGNSSNEGSDNGSSNTVKSNNGNSNTGSSSTGESGGEGNYSSSFNSLGIDYIDSPQIYNSDSAELYYNHSEQLDYNDSEWYNDSEQYFAEDESYTYDSSSSNLDVVRDLYWMGIDIIEPSNNIYSRELVTRNVMGGYPVRFDFVENATLITYIEFDPMKTFRKTTTSAVVLKDMSVFVPEIPTGRVYQYTDIFVGDKGAGLSTSLKNGLVGFKVEKAWIRNNDVKESLVTLQWYNNSWEPLYTEKVGEDNNYIF